MTTSKKPYRVYRQPRRIRGDGSIPWADQDGLSSDPRSAGIPRRMLRFIRRVLFVALVATAALASVAFLSFRSAVSERNAEVPKKVHAALAPTNGPALVSSRVIMLVGSDSSKYRTKIRGTEGGRADTLMLVRVDVRSRSVSMLSIPRDLYVEVPGFGQEKINSAFANGGLPLAIRTVRNVTGIDVNHVVQIDFDGFKELVDALGGITIHNPYMVRSGNTPFDGRHWTFPRGKLDLDGKHALAYARIRYVDDRTIELNEQEGNELGRARRQQRVIDAITRKLLTRDSILRPRDVPRAVVQPLLTDITASEMIVFGFGKWWSKPDNSLRCRLGGYAETNSERESVVVPTEDNRAAVRMFLGKQAPLPPENGLAPGCVRLGK